MEDKRKIKKQGIQMNLKDYVKNVLIEVEEAVDEARGSSRREIAFNSTDHVRTVEFDIAVTAEKNKKKGANVELSVLQVLSLGGGGSSTTASSVVNRIKFGIDISTSTKSEMNYQIDNAEDSYEGINSII